MDGFGCNVASGGPPGQPLPMRFSLPQVGGGALTEAAHQCFTEGGLDGTNELRMQICGGRACSWGHPGSLSLPTGVVPQRGKGYAQA